MVGFFCKRVMRLESGDRFPLVHVQYHSSFLNLNLPIDG